MLGGVLYECTPVFSQVCLLGLAKDVGDRGRFWEGRGVESAAEIWYNIGYENFYEICVGLRGSFGGGGVFCTGEGFADCAFE